MCRQQCLRGAFDGYSPGHLPLYWYQEQFAQQYAASFKFAFVRDPLERAYSAYAFLRGNTLGPRDHAAQELVGQYRDFDDFVARWLHSENITRQMHFAAQTDFLTDSSATWRWTSSVIRNTSIGTISGYASIWG